jgi:hypothetical protein
MSFGLTVVDVISAFPGAEDINFATADLSGAEVIINEIELQKNKILTSLPAWVANLLDYVHFEIIKVDSNGDFELSLPTNGVVSAWSMSNMYSFRGTSYGCSKNVCFDGSTLTSANTVDITMTDETNGNIANYTYDELIVSYPVDPDAEIGSLKSILRNCVVASLGHSLYPTENSTDVWSHVKYHHEQCEKWSGMLSRLVPIEIKKIKLLNKPIMGIRFGNITRSS